jgi:predicted nucleic acid-binding protein
MRLIWDASALVAIVTISDAHHHDALAVWVDHKHDVSIFPALAWFEFQATISRLRREKKAASRGLNLLDHKNVVLPIDNDFVRRCAVNKLVERFTTLRGADLVYACAAVLEDAALVTFDSALRKLEGLTILPR